jgi:transcriptional regulator with GAF, ATPase, and Fis domain
MTQELQEKVQNEQQETHSATARLQEELRFTRLIASLSNRFIKLEAGQVDSKIVEALGNVCEELGLDRSAVGQLTPDGSDMEVTHSWAAPGFAPVPGITEKDLPWLVGRLREHKEVKFTRIEELPAEAVQDKATFRHIDTRSLAVFPIFAGGKLFGAVGFDSVRYEIEWSDQQISRLRLFCELLTSAVERKWIDKSLQDARSQIKMLNEQLEYENRYLREEIRLEHDHTAIVGHSDALIQVLRRAEQVASADSTVLLLGETGTGKELVARTIHEHSRRAPHPMVKVNCAALPASLVESELFGREKGAYTGALTREIGRFELANNSTLFLDEIGELPSELQAKLLRVLQEGEFERLGSPKTIRVNVRVIAATSRDLTTAVREGSFRQDLFYRLNVFPIVLPPLRERREDIPELVWHFIRELGGRVGRNVETVRSSTMKTLQNYWWPGNVRELHNLIERSLILSPGPELIVEPLVQSDPENYSGGTLEEVERIHIRRVLESTRWRVRGPGGAAAILGLKPTTLESRLKKLRIVRP